MNGRFFAHSRLDGLLVLAACVQFAVLLAGVLTFGSAPWGVSLLLGLASVFLTCTNYQCVAHNFIHNPFFASARLNRAFSVFNSLLLGGPQTLYRFHHLHHHRYNNDAPDPRTGTTKDMSSTWRYGEYPWREEGILTYSLFGYFRSDFRRLVEEAKRRGREGAVREEAEALVLMLAVFAVLNPLGLAAFYLPVWLLGNMAAVAENYLEHYGALPGDRRTDSVSSYGRLYNLVWFNNGYHQEHHYRPQVHWTRLPEITPLLPPPSQRRVVRWAHWFNFAPRRLPATAAFPPRAARAVVFAVDGAGGFDEVAPRLDKAVAEAGLPLGVRHFRWTHGYGRVIADQVYFSHVLRQGKKLADAIWRCQEESPGLPISLVGHSAGCAVILAAAEHLPHGTLDRIVLLSPAVSARYDLRPALACARRGIDAFYSARDWVWLGIGVFLIGTTDRRWGPAAGRVGFRPSVQGPADKILFSGLRQHAWSPELSWTGHTGGHDGSHQPRFLREFVVPLLDPGVVCLRAAV